MSIAFPNDESHGGTITNINGNSPITVTSIGGNPANRLVALSNTAVIPGDYTNANISVDSKGRIIAASSSPTPPVFSGAGLFISVPLVLASGVTSPPISWDGESYDTDVYHSGGTPTKLIAPTSGLYRINILFHLQNRLTGVRYVNVNVNGVGITYASVVTTTGGVLGDAITISCEIVVPLLNGDFVECTIYQDSGLTVNLLAETVPMLMIERLT